MTDALLLTKLFVPPPRSNLVFRPRLVARLNDGLSSGRKLTLISAPAGFGKTTLVSEWVAGARGCPEGQRCGDEVAWLSLDEADNDPVRFVSYLVAALQTLQPGIGAGVLSALQSSQPVRVDTLLTDLLNEISNLPKHFVLILDDFHAIDSRSVDQSLEFLVEHLPPQMHLVINTREDPALPLARYRARGQLTELRAADLRFTAAEAAEFLNQVTGLGLSVEEIAALETRTEGWIAGLQLAAISMRGHKDAAGFIQSFTGSHRFVMDYLLEEVLQQQPANIQAFLLRTSILERMCGPLCDTLMEDPSVPGQNTLESLERSNLFIVPLDSERRWYRYHHLFGDLLRKRLEQNLTAEGAARLHLQASQWYETEGLILEAFKHAAASGDLERTRDMMEHKDMPQNLPGVPKTILNWLESLPEPVLNANPGLWWKQAAMMMCNYQTIGVEEKLQATEAALALRNPPGTELDEWARNLVGKIAVARASLAQTYYQADACLTQANKALEYLHPDNTSYRSGATQIIGFAQYLKGDREAAQKAYTEALSLAQAAGDSESEGLAITRLGQIYEITNKLHLAHETYERALKFFGENPPPFAGVIILGLARIHHEWNDLEKAQELGDRSYQLALRNLEVIDRMITTEMFFARLSLSRNDPEGAERHLNEADKHARRMDFVKRIPHIAGERALVALFRGDLETAAQLAQACECPVTKARVLLATGDPSAALELLLPLSQTSKADGGDEARLQAIVVLALVHQALGEPEQARQVLLEALTLAEPGGFIRLFVDLREPVRGLLLSLKNQGEGRDIDLAPSLRLYLDKILAAFADPQTSLPVNQTDLDDVLLEGLSPRELEVLRLICQGLSNQEICQRLFLALDTVKGHNRRIFEKLQVHSRTEAIARARELGLI